MSVLTRGRGGKAAAPLFYLNCVKLDRNRRADI